MKRRRIGVSKKEESGHLEPEVQIKKGQCSSGKVKKGSFEHRFERRRYLNQLAHEFQSTAAAMECKEQVLANLANFAYDPYNYQFFQEIGIIPIFLAELTVDRNEKLTEFAMSGICNCSVDKRIQKEILRKNGLPLLKRHVYSSSVTTIISAVTSLFNFVATGNNVSIKDQIMADDFRLRLVHLLAHDDKRVKNVVQALLNEVG